MNPRFIAVLAEYNSRIIEEAPEEGKDEYTIYTAIEAIEDNYETWQYVNEFMYIATHVPSKLWEKEDFVYHMICYGFEWLYDDKEKAKEFFDMISKKLWNKKRSKNIFAFWSFSFLSAPLRKSHRSHIPPCSRLHPKKCISEKSTRHIHH